MTFFIKKIKLLYTLFPIVACISLYAHYRFEFVAEKTVTQCLVNAVHSTESAESSPWITVWVHGTRCFSRPFFRNFFNIPQGLTKALLIPEKVHGNYLAKTICSQDPCSFDLENFYMFGWSGFLTVNARQRAARELADSLTILINAYKAQNIHPKLRIITHSHGGNVALHLAEENTTITIDELILLACPVQERTKKCIEHTCFKTIISFYSAWDITQIADPQGLYSDNKSCPFFSERTFPTQANLLQVELWHNNRGPMHIEFLLCDYLSGIARLLPTLRKYTHTHFSSHFCPTEPKPIQKLRITTTTNTLIPHISSDIPEATTNPL